MIEFSVTHTEDGVRDVYHRFWKKRYGRLYRALLLFAVAAMVVVIGMTPAHWSAYVVVAVLIIAAAVLATIRDSATRMAIAQFRQLQPAGLSYRMDAEGVLEVSGHGRVNLNWSAFENWCEVDGFFLLLRQPASAGMFVAFPVAQFPDAARTLVLAHLAELKR